MQMAESRAIFTKQVQPEDSTKQIETEFIANLKSANPNISESEIQDKVSDYELNKSFYIPDSSQFSNTFSTIKEIGMTVSNYAYNRSKHWISNYDEIVGAEKDNKIFTAQNILDLRSLW
jgi:hypothetical protein